MQTIPGKDKLVDAARSILEGRLDEVVKKSGVQTELSAIYKTRYPEKSELKALFKKFPAEPDIFKDGDSYGHPETVFRFKDKTRLVKVVNGLRKAMVESDETLDEASNPLITQILKVVKEVPGHAKNYLDGHTEDARAELIGVFEHVLDLTKSLKK
jgi:hypothetical protein